MTGKYVRFAREKIMKRSVTMKIITHSEVMLSLLSNLFRPFQMIINSAHNIMFLPNVCQFVRWIASPKHPQSDTGFVSASRKVRGVKIMRRIIITQMPVFSLKPVRREKPEINSAVHIKIASGRLILFKNPR
jgi:hypothetical protein